MYGREKRNMKSKKEDSVIGKYFFEPLKLGMEYILIILSIFYEYLIYLIYLIFLIFLVYLSIYFPGGEVSMVKEVTVFVHEEFNTETFDSCKNVQYPEVRNTHYKIIQGCIIAKQK